MKSTTKIKIYEEGKIDIHKRVYRYTRALQKLQDDITMIPRNKDLILTFIRDCTLGKTVLGKSKKKIGPARCHKYVKVLTSVSQWLGKAFDSISQADMEYLIERLESNQLMTQNGHQFAEATKADVKRAIKKFWKWKDGANRNYPELVDWIDTSETFKDVPALTRSEVETLIDYCSNSRDKALIMVLFDSGARIEELLNVRLKEEHIKWHADVGVYKVRLEFSKTRPRTISLPLSTDFLRKWLQVHPAKENPQSQLFPLTYGNARMIMYRLGRKLLNKRVNPHLFRHSSATYYANKLTRYQLCYRFGWTMSSRVVDRYLDREGILEDRTVEVVKESESGRVSKVSGELSEELSLMRESYSLLMKRFEDMQRELLEAKRRVAYTSEVTPAASGTGEDLLYQKSGKPGAEDGIRT